VDLVIDRLVKGFQDKQDLTRLSDAEAFETFATFCVLSAFYEGEFNPDAFRTGGGNDLGIDGFAILVNGELLHDASDVQEAVENAVRPDIRVVVVQAKTSAKFETKVVSDLAENLRHVVGPIPIPYPTSADVDNLCACLVAVYDNIAKLSGGLPQLHIRYVTTGEQVADMVQQKTFSAEAHLLSLGRFGTVDFRCVTRDQLRELYHRATTAVSATFTMPKKVILPKIPDVRQALQGVVSAPDLVDHLLTDPGGSIRKTLFDENVRDFQGYNEVNSGIRETLRDPVRRKRFSVLNNGIIIVTRELTPVGDEIHVQDFQIVNGCQTCHVLFDQRDILTDDVQVGVRIVHTQDEDVVNGIVAATNRQTAITNDDLSAREAFHKRLEDYFAAQDKPCRLYYERRSKQYTQREDVEKTRVISRTQLAKAYLAMFLGEPARVGRYKALLESRGKELFVDGHPPDLYYAAAATSYRLEWLIRNRRIDATYAPARYHLLAAIRTRLLGSALPIRNPRTAASESSPILKAMWDPAVSEQLVLSLLRPLQRAITLETETGTPLRDLVRTQRFAELVTQEVLATAAGERRI
jgi:hypothetical protein